MNLLYTGLLIYDEPVYSLIRILLEVGGSPIQIKVCGPSV